MPSFAAPPGPSVLVCKCIARLTSTSACAGTYFANASNERGIWSLIGRQRLPSRRCPLALNPILQSLSANSIRLQSNVRFAGSTAASSSYTKHASAHARNADPDAVCVVVGASRGIGLAITQQLFRRFKGRVFALCRQPESAGALSALFQFNPDRMTLLPIDITDEDSVIAAAAAVKEVTGGRVDVLIHTAGILHDNVEGGSGAMPETSLGRVKLDFLQRNLLVNTVGPLLVFKHFSSMLATSRKSHRVSPSVLATLTARVGSIQDNHLGGWISYRASKAAHNQVLRTTSIELGRRGVICIALHPGTVNTDLSMPFQKNVPAAKLFPVDNAAGMLLDVIDSVGPEDNGSFFDYNRDRIPW
jgi:NAD(P)-dependent dehydrogenase (short-subunit alcohol dehydrogenase family)